MLSLKTLALRQIVENTLNPMADNVSTYANELLVAVCSQELSSHNDPETTFHPNLSEALETSRVMVAQEIYQSVFRFKGTLREAQNGEEDMITITKIITASPGKDAHLNLSIKSGYQDNITQFKLTIHDGFLSASQIGKDLNLVQHTNKLICSRTSA